MCTYLIFFLIMRIRIFANCFIRVSDKLDMQYSKYLVSTLDIMYFNSTIITRNARFYVCIK